MERVRLFIKRLSDPSFSKIYVIAMLLISLLVVGGYFSYAMFTVSKERSNAISIVTGNLIYDLKVDGEDIEELTVLANTTMEFTITLTNPNNRIARFNFYYVGSLPSGVIAGYLEEDAVNIPPTEAGLNLEQVGTSGSSNTYKIKVTNTTGKSITINLGASVGLDYNDLTLPSNGHLFEKYKINLGDAILTDPDNSINRADAEQYFVTGDNPDNYIWYSGKLWRAVSVDPNNATVKAITNETISAMGTWGSSSSFSGSYMQSWLNNTDSDGFLGSLDNPEKYIDMDSKWNATMMTNSSAKPSSTTMVTNAVGLINSYEYNKGIDWLLTNEYYFLLNPSSSTSVYINGNFNDNNIGTFNGIGTLLNVNGCMIRPSVNFFSSLSVLSGTGTVDDPYIISDNTAETNDLLNTRLSGEWLKFNNEDFRIVDVEANGTVKIVAANAITNRAFSTNSSSTFSSTDTSNVGYYLNNTYYNSIASEYKEMLVTGPWYLGSFSYGSSWKLEKCSTEACTTPSSYVVARVGLLRNSELMSAHTGGELKSYWTITPSTSTANSVKVNGIYGSNWEEVANRTTGSRDSSALMVRPALYLNSNVRIVGGNGTKESPFMISFEAIDDEGKIKVVDSYNVAVDYAKYDNGSYVLYTDTFKIVSGANNSYVIDLQNGSTANGTNVQLYQDNNSVAQRFKFKAVADNHYNIAVASLTSRGLDVYNGSSAPGTNIQIYDLSSYDSPAQKWALVSAGDGYYYIKSALGTCIDVANGTATNNANVQTYTCNHSTAQKWKFVKIN